MSQIVVSDSTCLIALERIQRLDLLPALFDQVWIPSEVAREFGYPLPWLLVRSPQNAAVVSAYQMLVDAGEAEAIALAKELGCCVILDDARARQLAGSQGVACIGLLGLLIRAKKSGIIAAVKPVMVTLQANGFFMSNQLMEATLRRAGE